VMAHDGVFFDESYYAFLLSTAQSDLALYHKIWIF